MLSGFFARKLVCPCFFFLLLLLFLLWWWKDIDARSALTPSHSILEELRPSTYHLIETDLKALQECYIGGDGN